MGGGSNNGARKVAILLSILEPKTVCALLDRFDPRVASVIAEEAKRIKAEPVSAREIEPIVHEFVRSFGDSEPELTRAILDQANKALVHEDDTNSFVETNSSVKNVDGNAFDWGSVDTVLVAQLLAEERPTIVSCLLNSFPLEFREKVLGFLPSSTRDFYLKEYKFRQEDAGTRAEISKLVSSFISRLNNC